MGADLVVVPDANAAPAHPAWVVIVREGKMVTGIQPTVVGVAEAIEGADVDQDADLGRRLIPSSVRDVTVFLSSEGTRARQRFRGRGDNTSSFTSWFTVRVRASS